MTRKLIIFDLDGTLIDSLHDLTAAVNHMLDSFGRASLSLPEVRSLVGKGARNLVERALPGATESEVNRGLDLFLGYNEAHLVEQTALYPGVTATLDTFRRLNAAMVVVTNKNGALSRRILRALGIDHYFRGIYGADDFPAKKPSPEPLLRVMAQWGFAPEETIMVGDSINDIAAGADAGVTTVGCCWGYGGPGELSAADWRIEHFTALPSLPFFTG